MAIIPDDKHYSAKAVFRSLEDLVFWADVPEREALPADWAASYRDLINSKLAFYTRIWSEDPDAVHMAERCNRVCREFISLMGNVPGLSQIPRLKWTVPSHIKVFDELADIRDSFARMAEVEAWDETPAKPVDDQTAIDAKSGKKVQTKKRWTVPEIQMHCELAMKSQNPETIQNYLFLAGKELATRIGCDAKTLAETEFWKKRPQEQANWRRQNTAGLPARKRNAL